MKCYCGSARSFTQCCEPIINNIGSATFPEQLMRSRYSAYATKNAHYIYLTYANESRANQSESDIAQWANETSWLSLKIINSDNISIDELNQHASTKLPVVTFSVIYVHQGTLYRMTESSRFVNESGCWLYLDGDIIEHGSIKPPKRNDLCLCNSGKKFKVCCALKS